MAATTTHTQQIVTVAGDDCQIEITVRDADGAPVSLAGAMLRMTVRDDYGHPTARVVLTSEPGGGIQVTDTAGGRAIATLPGSATEGVAIRRAVAVVYDVDMVSSDGLTATVARGRIVVLPDVSD